MGNAIGVFINGLSYGLIFFLLAAGMTLTMGLMRIVNMAHGALYMVGAYVGIWTFNETGENFVLAVIAGAAAAGAIGIILEVGFLRRLYKKEGSQVLLTIGFIYILQNLCMWIWGPDPQGGVIPESLYGVQIIGGTYAVTNYRLFIIGFGLVMAALLWLLQDKSRLGARVRAGMDNREIAGSLGINLRVLFTGVFALGSFVAGMCGILGSDVNGASIFLGWKALLFSLIVVVIGGTGSIQGALVGGVFLGLLLNFGEFYFPTYKEYFMYGALIIILLVRPAGLLGRKMAHSAGGEELEKATGLKKKKSEAARPALVAVDPHSPRARLLKWGPFAAVFLALAIVPQFIGVYPQSLLSRILILAIFAMSLDLIMGYTGLISFGHAAYFGFSGYCIGLISIHYGITSLWILMPLALGATTIAAAVIGYLCLRVSGVYFLLVTMAFGQLLTVIAVNWVGFTGGTDGTIGIKSPEIGGGLVDFGSELNLYYLVFAFFAVCFFLLYRIANSSFGRALVGIRDNEPRMRSLGYNTWAMKYTAVILAGTFAGVAGALFAWLNNSMFPTFFSLEYSALPMLMVIMGGAATLWGPCIGAAVLVVAQEIFSQVSRERWPLMLGIIFVLCVMFLEGGFARYLTSFWKKMGLTRPPSTAMPETKGSEVEA